MTRHLRSALAGLAALAALAFGVQPASAYVVWTCNGDPAAWQNIVNQYHGDAFQGGAADWFGGFEESLGLWAQNPSILSFWGSIDVSIGLNPAPGNYRSEIWAQANDATDIFNSDAYAAVGPFWLSGCTIDEGDVIYNTAYDWVRSESKADYDAYGSNQLSLQAVTVHELGHNAGFLHNCSIYNVMGRSTTHLSTNGNDTRQYVGEDVVNGLLTIYNFADFGIPSLLENDASVVHWRRQGCDGEYSTHTRTEIFDTAGDILTVVDEDAVEPRYIAAAGQTVEPRFTFENLGDDPLNGLEVGFYYSTNSRITTLDRRIGGVSINLIRDQPDTLRFAVTLPDDLPQGDGYLGAIVDENDLINEISERNNATYIPISVQGSADDGDGEGDGNVAYRYAAKFVCGVQPDATDKRLEPGTYSTTVNILNPNNRETRIIKDVAMTYPPDPQVQGETYRLGTDPIASLHALETNCDDIRERIFNGSFPTSYVEGFVVVTAPDSLEVTAVYSASGLPGEPIVSPSGGGAGPAGPGDLVNPQNCRRRHCDCNPCGCGGGCKQPCCDGGNGDGPGGTVEAGVSIDIEQIRERILKPETPPDGEKPRPDLIPVAGTPTFPPVPATGFCRISGGNLVVRVRNIGMAQAQTSVTTVTYEFDNQPILRATATLGAAGHPIDEIDVLFPFPRACFTGNDCPFTILVDSGGHNTESNEANNQADGVCLLPEG
jgi:hypothetical protein